MRIYDLFRAEQVNFKNGFQNSVRIFIIFLEPVIWIDKKHNQNYLMQILITISVTAACTNLKFWLQEHLKIAVMSVNFGVVKIEVMFLYSTFLKLVPVVITQIKVGMA